MKSLHRKKPGGPAAILEAWLGGSQARLHAGGPDRLGTLVPLAHDLEK